MFAITAKKSNELLEVEAVIKKSAASMEGSGELQQRHAALLEKAKTLTEGVNAGVAGCKEAAKAWRLVFKALVETEKTQKALAGAETTLAALEAGEDETLDLIAQAHVARNHNMGIVAAAKQTIAEQEAQRQTLG